jgi:hypothetical protein
MDAVKSQLTLDGQDNWKFHTGDQTPLAFE